MESEIVSIVSFGDSYARIQYIANLAREIVIEKRIPMLYIEYIDRFDEVKDIFGKEEGYIYSIAKDQQEAINKISEKSPKIVALEIDFEKVDAKDETLSLLKQLESIDHPIGIAIASNTVFHGTKDDYKKLEEIFQKIIDKGGWCGITRKDGNSIHPMKTKEIKLKRT